MLSMIVYSFLFTYIYHIKDNININVFSLTPSWIQFIYGSLDGHTHPNLYAYKWLLYNQSFNLVFVPISRTSMASTSYLVKDQSHHFVHTPLVSTFRSLPPVYPIFTPPLHIVTTGNCDFIHYWYLIFTSSGSTHVFMIISYRTIFMYVFYTLHISWLYATSYLW